MSSMFMRRLFHDFQERRRIVRKARTRVADLIGDESVVEIGCGFGPNSEYCKGAYLGVDISLDAIREAEKRYPTKDFLHGDVATAKDAATGRNTVLFCVALHEMSNYADVLNAFTETGIHRIIVCDYDPELRGWLRFGMNLLEPDAAKWWDSKPSQFLPESEWSLQSGQITRSLLWWEFTRKGQ